MKILVCDPVSPKGIALLQHRPEFEVVVLPKRLTEAELLPVVKDAVALVVRSETKVTRNVIEAASALRVVGRAGVGVDNVDVEAATQRGVVVMNTPGGNTVSTAELTFTMLLSLARKKLTARFQALDHFMEMKQAELDFLLEQQSSRPPVRQVGRAGSRPRGLRSKALKTRDA